MLSTWNLCFKWYYVEIIQSTLFLQYTLASTHTVSFSTWTCSMLYNDTTAPFIMTTFSRLTCDMWQKVKFSVCFSLLYQIFSSLLPGVHCHIRSYHDKWSLITDDCSHFQASMLHICLFSHEAISCFSWNGIYGVFVWWPDRTSRLDFGVFTRFSYMSLVNRLNGLQPNQ